MSEIAGIVRKTEGKVGLQLEQMLGAARHLGKERAGFFSEATFVQRNYLEELDLINQDGRLIVGHTKLPKSHVQYSDSGLGVLLMGEVFNTRVLAEALGIGNADDPKSLCEILLHYMNDRHKGDLEATVGSLVAELDGVFALAVTNRQRVVIARDPMGIRPFYYCLKEGEAAFATEKKSILALEGHEADVRRLEPGQMLSMRPGSTERFTYSRLEELRPEGRITDLKQATAAYGETVQEAVRKRVKGKDRVGVIYSGGIDSLLIAYLIKQTGVPFTCYTAGRQGASDLDWARSTAMEMGFPIKIKTIALSEIETYLPDIIETIEDHSFNQVEAATAMFMANRMAASSGEHTVFTGQAADELFGGYPWYPAIVEKEGYEQFEQYAFEDFCVGYKETFERENKIAEAHGLSMSVPYADPAVVKIAFQISPELKIPRDGNVVKRFHRELALNLGIPQKMALRKKEAAQHGANVHHAFVELAGIDDSLLKAAGYNQDVTVTEKLGSSSRYGYKYGDEGKWKPIDSVQYYLDNHAAKLGLLRPEARRHLDEVAEKLGRLTS